MIDEPYKVSRSLAKLLTPLLGVDRPLLDGVTGETNSPSLETTLSASVLEVGTVSVSDDEGAGLAVEVEDDEEGTGDAVGSGAGEGEGEGAVGAF